MQQRDRLLLLVALMCSVLSLALSAYTLVVESRTEHEIARLVQALMPTVSQSGSLRGPPPALDTTE